MKHNTDSELSDDERNDGIQSKNMNQENENLKYYKLIDTKKARKRVEDNYNKLENRINLLEKEKSRVLKKINNLKKKALEVMKVRKRNAEIQKKRDDYQKKKQEDLIKKQNEIQYLRAQQEEKLNASKFQKLSDSIRKAKNTKQGLETLRNEYHKKKQEILENNMMNAEAIRELKSNAKIKKQMFEEEKKKVAKKRYLEDVNDELEKKNELETKIKDLEKKENALIEALQQSNQLEMMAMEDLKKVINGEEPDFLQNLDLNQLIV